MCALPADPDMDVRSSVIEDGAHHPDSERPADGPNGTSGTPTIPRRSIQARRVHVGGGDGVRVARMVAASPPEIDLDAVRRRTAKARMYRDRNVPSADSPRYRDVSVL